jgi:hypothetical protein
MPAAWSAMLGALLVLGACYSAGTLALRWAGAKLASYERLPVAFLLGASLLHLAIFAIFGARIGYKPVWWILLIGTIAAAAATRQKQAAAEKPDWKLRIIFVATAVPFTIVYLAVAWAPEVSSDGAGYHLGVIARYLREHAFVRIPTTMYADLSQGIDLLYAPAFAIGKHSAAALIHVGFAIAFALAIYAYGRRIGKPWAGAAAALIVYVSPVVGRDATTAYIDVATAAIAFAAFYWLELWDQQRTTRMLILAGAMAGYAFAAKYTMFVVVPFAVFFLLWKERRWKTIFVLCAAASVMIAPWLAKNWILVNDPVAPFLTKYFPSPYIHTLVVEEWAAYLRRYGIENLWTLPREVILKGGVTQGVIGPVFLLAPLGLLAIRDRRGRLLLAMGALLLATYFQNLGTRFLIPALPFFALALAIAVERWKPALTALALTQALFSWYPNVSKWASLDAWRLYETPYKSIFRNEAREKYLRSHIPDTVFLHRIEQITKPGDRIFFMPGSAMSYTSREVFSGYEGAENNLCFDLLNVARMEDFRPQKMLVFRFAEAKARKIRVVLTAQGKSPEQWNVFELRYYAQGRELQRDAAWRITSKPNPWEIQFAFDNSLATRWRSWQTGEPGMYIETDFGSAQPVDEVRMLTSKDFEWPFQFEVTVWDGSAWRKIMDKFDAIPQNGKIFLGRAATYEMLMRGVTHIVIPDAEEFADEIADDADAWGLKLMLRFNQMSFYKIVPP